MTSYTYQGKGKLRVNFLQLNGLLIIGFFTILAIALPVIAFFDKDTSVATGFCIGLWPLGIGWILGSGMLNVYPSIWITENGLEVSYFRKLRAEVRWEDITEIKLRLRVPSRPTLIKARKITPWHRITGWVYGDTLSPSFIIGRDIENYEELMAAITLHAKAARLVEPKGLFR